MENTQKLIKLDDLEFKPYLSEDKIRARVVAMSDLLNKEYAGKKPLFLAILNGSFLFAADLIREMKIDCEITFVKAASYVGTQSSQQLHVSLGPSDILTDREIIIIEDIVDSGHTLSALLPMIAEKKPSSIKIASLLYKPAAFKGDFKIDYVGFEIPNDFIVGYGLDYNGLGRNLKDIYVLAN